MVEMIAERNEAICVKEALSGTTLVDQDASSYIQRMINKLDKGAHVDHFFCQLSTNDSGQNKPLGTLGDSKDIHDFDTHTIIGAIEYIIAYAKQTWGCAVSFYTNPYYYSEEYHSDLYGKMVEALLQIKEKWGIGVLDFWNNEEMKNISDEQRQRWMADITHPTKEGYLEWWTPKFEEYLQNFPY